MTASRDPILGNMDTLPGMSDTDLAIGAYTEGLDEIRASAAHSAGNVAVVRTLQSQVWEEYSKNTLPSLEEIVAETVDLVRPHPITGMWEQDMGLLETSWGNNATTAYWNFRQLRNANGHDLYIDTTVQLVPATTMSDERAQLRIAREVLGDLVVYGVTRSSRIFGLEPVFRGLKHAVAKTKYTFDKEEVRSTVQALAIHQPGYINAKTTVRPVGEESKTSLHDTGMIALDRLNPTYLTRSLSPLYAERVLHEIGDTSFEVILGALKKRVANETHLEQIQELRLINEILRGSYPLTSADK